MESVIVELRNDKALQLLKDLEVLEILRIRKSEEKRVSPLSKYKGIITGEASKDLIAHVEQIRNEWDRI